MFSDSVYGGKESARRAARKFKSSAIAKVVKDATKAVKKVISRVKPKAKKKPAARKKPAPRKAAASSRGKKATRRRH